MDSHRMRERRFLALWMPYLPVERWQIKASSPPDPDIPFVMVEKIKGALRLAACNAAAHSSGLTFGIALADARARFPNLHVEEMDAVGDAVLLTKLAKLALNYTPIVAEDPPDGLILDISGAAHLFGGETAMLRHIIQRLRSFTLRPAFASHPDAARAIARWGDPNLNEKEAIDALPLSALELDSDDSRALRRAGLVTIGKIRVRSQASIAARFGEETVRALRRLYGEESRPLVPHEVAPKFVSQRRFAEPIGKTEHVLEVACDLMRDLAAALREQRLGGRGFRLQLFRTDGDIRTLQIETSAPTRDVAVIERLLKERIDHLADPLDPGFGYDMMRMSVVRTDPLLPQQIEDDGKARDQQSVTALIDRLATRYGAEAIRCLIPRDHHIPERAQTALPVVALNQKKEAFPPCDIADDAPPHRPLWLFDPPEMIEVMAEVPDGPPHNFRWRDKRYDVALAEGPERIAGEWWRAPLGHWPGHGAAGQGERTRDYYRIEDNHGHRFWLFRAGFYGDGTDQLKPNWYIHGLFA